MAQVEERLANHELVAIQNELNALNSNLLLNDTNTETIKRSIQAASQFYKALVQWIASANSSQSAAAGEESSNTTQGTSSNSVNLSDDLKKTWLIWLQIENFICNLFESTKNDGVRAQCIKFLEIVVLMQTPCDNFTDSSHKLNLIDLMITPVKQTNEPQEGTSSESSLLFSDEHKLELVEAAKLRFDQLVKFHGAPYISSANLMAVMQSLVVLAKQRCRLFMGRVIQAMESLNTKLPPTLTESQVQSVKKFLKLQLTVMLKHPYSLDRFQHQITQLLQAVGSKQPEIHKVISDYKQKFGCEPQAINNNNANQEIQKRIKLEPGVKQQPILGSQSSLGSQQIPVGKSKHLDLNKLTQELDENEKCQIVVDSVKRILGDEKRVYISPAQMEIKKKVLSTLANEFHDTDCPKIIQDYIFEDLKNRHEICYAIIKKHYDVAAAAAAKRQIQLDDQNQELLKHYIECYNSYQDRAMNLKDTKDKEIILPKLFAIKKEYYERFEDQEQDIRE